MSVLKLGKSLNPALSMKKTFNDEEGFTLLELVTAVGVLLLLTVIGLLSYNGITKNSKQAAVNRAVNEVYDRATGYLLDNNPETTVQTAEDEYNNASKYEPGKKRVIVNAYDLGSGRVKVTAVYGDDEARAVRQTPNSEDDGIIVDPGDNSSPPVVSTSAIFTFKCDEDKGGRLGFTGTSGDTQLTVVSDSSTETYSPSDFVGFSAGVEYTVTLNGSYTTYNGKYVASKDCLREVESFGSGVTTISYLGANIVAVPDTIPETVTSLNGAFNGSHVFNQDLNNWDISNVTDLYGMFSGANIFNNGEGHAESTNPLAWDVSNVNDVYGMFGSAYAYNQPFVNEDKTGPWNTKNFKTLQSMFYDATSFNQPLDWNTDNVESVAMMFSNAKSFNQNVNTRTNPDTGEIYWNLSNSLNFSQTFVGTDKFNNGDLPGDSNNPMNWDTSKGTSIFEMFYLALSFNQNIDSFDTSNMNRITGTFNGAKLFNNGEKPGMSNKPLLWNTSNMIRMDEAFLNAESFNQDISSWDTSKVIDHYNFKEGAILFEDKHVPSGLIS